MANGSPFQLTIGESTVGDFKSILSIPLEKFEKIKKILERYDDSVPKFSTLVDEIGNVVELASSEAIVRQGMSYSSFNSRFQDSGVDAFDFLVATLSQHPNFEVTDSDWLNENGSTIKEIFSASVFRILAKVNDLVFHDEPIFRSARFVLDVRPIFDDNRSSIIGNALISRIFVQYHEGGQDSTVQLQVDFRDIRELRRLCDEAESKMEHVRRSYVADRGASSLVVPGED